MVLSVRVAAIVAGVILFVVAERVELANNRKPYASGRERAQTFYDDAKVGTLRLAGVGLVVCSLISWVIGNHLAPH